MADVFTMQADGSVSVAAGRYWLGDPCPAFSYEEWDALILNAGYFLKQPLGRVSGIQALAYHVDNGSYACEAGEVVVYADTVGLVPARAGKPTPKGMLAVTMEAGDTCRAGQAGARFGRLNVVAAEPQDTLAPPAQR